MAQPYIGEIRMFAGTFAPVGWALCDGQLVPIASNDALFTLIGTTYGGDGEQTFALPDLRGRLPVHQRSTTDMGAMAGSEEVTLTVNQIPVHTHPVLGSTALATDADPGGRHPAQSRTANVDLYIEDVPTVSMAAQAIAPVGGSQPHTNLQPYLCVNFIIAMFGIFPSPT